MSFFTALVYKHFPKLVTYRALLRGKTIRPEKIIKDIFSIDTIGTNTEKRDVPIIVSLTSFPERIHEVGCTIYSLFKQKCKPDRIILWLSNEEFPDHAIPDELCHLERYGLEIRWATNFYSYNKIIHTLSLCQDAIIVVCDDDIYYQDEWLLKLYSSYRNDLKKGLPKRIYMHRAHKITIADNVIAPYNAWKSASPSTSSILNMALGVAGILFPPYSLHSDAIRSDLFSKLCPKADDIWLWGMMVLNNYQTKVISDPIERAISVNYIRDKGGTTSQRLCVSNVQNGGNDIQLHALIDHYPELLQKVRQAAQEEARR